MQNNDMAKKIKLVVDNIELPELTRFGELFLEDLPVEVPSFRKIITILAGTVKINPVVCTFKIQRNAKTLKFLQTWREDRQVKDVTVIMTDGSGTEFARTILVECEAGNMRLPEYDASSPTYAMTEITLYPFDILELS